MKRSATVALALAFAAACAATPRVALLDDVARVRKSPPAKEAEALAPQAYREADALAKQAQAAADDGDRAAAELIAEHAIAAYQHAFVLARLARAEARSQQATARLQTASRDLAEIDAQQTRVATEADDLEVRVRVARDAMAITPVGPASAERERARLEAARTLGLQARLLCSAAQLLSAELEGLADTLAKVDALEKEIAGAPKVAPIENATRLRAACLSHITRARRPALRAAPEVSRADQLLEQLSRAKLEPYRDDRGVVVVLTGAFRGRQLTKEALDRLGQLGQVAQELGDTPLLAVVHSARGGVNSAELGRVEEVVTAVKKGGAPNVAGRAAGDAGPLVPQDGPRAAARNERIEIVFVTPSW